MRMGGGDELARQDQLDELKSSKFVDLQLALAAFGPNWTILGSLAYQDSCNNLTEFSSPWDLTVQQHLKVSASVSFDVTIVSRSKVCFAAIVVPHNGVRCPNPSFGAVCKISNLRKAEGKVRDA